MGEWYKRPMDLAILAAAHILLAPIWLALWTVIPLMIWLDDRGPIFYGQYLFGAWLLDLPTRPFEVELSVSWLTEGLVGVWRPVLLGSGITAVLFSTLTVAMPLAKIALPATAEFLVSVLFSTTT